MAKLVLIVLVVVISTMCDGRHTHPKTNVEEDIVGIMETEPEIDGMTVEQIRHIRQNNLVPINNIFFFRSYGPCAEEQQRDIFGICREVWD